MLFDIPIEPLEERYSAQWAGWFKAAFDAHCQQKWFRIYGSKVSPVIKNGAFLDVVHTNLYKASQLQRLCSAVEDGDLADDDIVFFHDLWFPGIEMLAYIRDGLGLKFKIYGCLHAGVYDPNDFLSKQGMRPWATHFEKSMLQIVDGVFVATNYHKDLICKDHPAAREKIHVTGFPIASRPYTNVQKDPRLVVFPHRLNDEKRPDLFAELAKLLGPTWHCVRTKDVCQTKSQYYELLERASVAVSFAEQETWGIAMQEALFCGCIPVVPNRLSYVEMYLPCLRFDTLDEAVQLVINNERNKVAAEVAFERLQESGYQAIERIMCKMGVWK